MNSETQITSKPTSITITNKYVPALKELESQADTKINALLSRAKSEYLNKKENGESINFGYFYNKYMAAAKELEKKRIVFSIVLLQ